MAADLRFDDQTVVIIGATRPIAEVLVQFFEPRGANIAIQDISIDPASRIPDALGSSDKVLVSRGAIDHSGPFVAAVTQKFGAVHVLINIADLVLHDEASFEQTDGGQWNCLMNVRQKSLFKLLMVAWPLFRKQGFGRFAHVTSSKSLNGGGVLESTATMSNLGFIQSLAKEGGKYNIIANLVATDVGMDETIPLIAQLVHLSNKSSTGSLFEVSISGATHVRWERSEGVCFNPDLPSFNPTAVQNQWSRICDFSKASYPNSTNNMMSLLEKSKKLPAADDTGDTVSFSGRVVVITGAGGNLGSSYARLFAKLGARVVVNDFDKADADAVVNEIVNFGGQAVANCDSVTDRAANIIQTAIKSFGRIDVLVNNAGFLLDQTFLKMTEDKWDAVLTVHLGGTYSMTKAAWPYFVQQKYGRVVNTSSTSGIYGFFGQTNYAAAKLGILGLTQALAREGSPYNIMAHAIAPVAGSQAAMDRGWGLPPVLKASYNAPLVVLLGSDMAPPSDSNYIFEQGSGWIAATRQRQCSYSAPSQISQNNSNVQTTNMEEFRRNIATAKAMKHKGVLYTYKVRDVLIYNLSVGARVKDLSLIYENDDHFQVVPTFGVIPGFQAIPLFGTGAPYGLDYIIPNFSASNLLHAEQYLEVAKYPIPSSGRLITDIKLCGVTSKGKNALVTFELRTQDADTSELVFYNEMSLFVRGAGGLGEEHGMVSRRSSSTVQLKPPPGQEPHMTLTEVISPEAAALYRLNADMHPMHINPEVSKAAGFSQPILHGLCTLGYAARILQREFGPIQRLQARFVSTVTPGQTLEVAFWRDGTTGVIFQAKLLETGKLCIADARAELRVESGTKL